MRLQLFVIEERGTLAACNMSKVGLVFPHQLFEEIVFSDDVKEIFVIEHPLFFTQYKFHKAKLIFHRASMKNYSDFLKKLGFKTDYIDFKEYENLFNLINNNVEVEYIDTVDNYLEKDLEKKFSKLNIRYNCIQSPMFLNEEQELEGFFKNKKKLLQTSFYISERKKRNILIDNFEKPLFGKWTFDTENRKKYPEKKTPPSVKFPTKNKYVTDAEDYIKANFSDNFGDISDVFSYPINFNDSKIWLKNFISERFKEYGIYQDAIVSNNSILNHSILSPLMNSGLLTPKIIIEQVKEMHEIIPINSLEGFIRQIMGWREFIRGVYVFHGTKQRNSNYFNFKRKIPKSFYLAETGIEPIDETIKKINKSAYASHIERLMILGNFMSLCEFRPNDVYQWFMELFIDSYDWVMVPNVYGMSQFSDGGLMSTKPYISSSNYILKMSNFKKGPWTEIWDALYWNFISNYADHLRKNMRMRFMVNMYEKFKPEKKEKIKTLSKDFLNKLEQS